MKSIFITSITAKEWRAVVRQWFANHHVGSIVDFTADEGRTVGVNDLPVLVIVDDATKEEAVKLLTKAAKTIGEGTALVDVVVGGLRKKGDEPDYFIKVPSAITNEAKVELFQELEAVWKAEKDRARGVDTKRSIKIPV